MTGLQRGTRWPLGLIGMIAIVALGEAWLGRHDELFTFIHAVAWKRADLAVREAAGSDVVAFGDSLVKQGVVPSALERRLGRGRKAYNLAISGSTPISHYVLLKRLLAVTGAAPPKAILVDGELLHLEPFSRVQPWADLLTSRETAELWWFHGDLSFFSEIALGRALRTVKNAWAIRRRIVRAIQGETPDDPNTLAVYLRNYKRNKGAEVVPARIDPPGKDPIGEKLEREDYSTQPWACNPRSARDVERFLALAGSRGITVYWLLPPTHPTLDAQRLAGLWWKSQVPYLEGLQARHPNMIVLDARRTGYAGGALFDTVHLNRTGAIAYSDDLGAVLRDRLGDEGRHTDRWVQMPRYDGVKARCLAAASSVEDTSQSGFNLARLMDEIRAGKKVRR